jgi:hypothetical protein
MVQIRLRERRRLKCLRFWTKNHSQTPSVTHTAGSHCGYVKNLRVNLNFLALENFFPHIYLIFSNTYKQNHAG